MGEGTRGEDSRRGCAVTLRTRFANALRSLAFEVEPAPIPSNRFLIRGTVEAAHHVPAADPLATSTLRLGVEVERTGRKDGDPKTHDRLTVVIAAAEVTETAAALNRGESEVTITGRIAYSETSARHILIGETFQISPEDSSF